MAAADSWFVDAKTEIAFFIKARPGYWPALKGKYKPLGVEGQLAWINRAAHTPAEQMVDLECVTVASQLVEWNVGRPLTPDVIRKLNGQLFLALRGIICYGEASDIDPQSSSLPDSEAVDTEKKSDD